MLKMKRKVRKGAAGPIDHWESPQAVGVALCGFDNLGGSSGVFDVLPYGQMVNAHTGHESLAHEVVECEACRGALRLLAAATPAVELVRTVVVPVPSRAAFELAAAEGEEGCAMCSG